MKLKKTYSFALWSSIYVTISSSLLALSIYFIFFRGKEFLGFLILIVFVFILSFFIIQYRAERFIYERIKKIYDEVSFLSADEFDRASATTNIEALSKSVQIMQKGKELK